MKIMWMKMTSFISKSKQGYLAIMNSFIVWIISFGAIGLLSQCESYDVELKEEHTSCPITIEDRDGDCSLNTEDAFPDDPLESKDTDSDGIGDNADFDDDGDLVLDTEDLFPKDALDYKDTDGDGIGDNRDKFPYDSFEAFDTDNDGVGDNTDLFPYNENEYQDTDGDGIGDNGDQFPYDISESYDTDNDGIGDNADLDDDGDGLIEIHDAEELNNMRYSLDGTSYKTSENIAANLTGCPDDGLVIPCYGYELVADIILPNPSANTIDNWVPIGASQSDSFSATFDGNGHTISNIHVSGDYPFAGFFGVVSGLIQNLYLKDGIISTRRTSNGNYLGGIAGYLDSDAEIKHVASSGLRVMGGDGNDNIGGLIGYSKSRLINSYSTSNVFGGSGNDIVGGLVGNNSEGSVISSYASNTIETSEGDDVIGGLVAQNTAVRTRSYQKCSNFLGFRVTCRIVYENYNIYGTVSDSYYKVNTHDNDDSDSDIGIPKTVSELQRLSLGVNDTNTNPNGAGDNWRATNWDMGSDSQYPSLRTIKLRATSYPIKSLAKYPISYFLEGDLICGQASDFVQCTH